MGGILSSSPELQETAMTFANGGGADLDTKFILTNIPELGIREGQFVKISGKTLEGLNNAIPEVMARHGDKVKSVELMMDERNSALVALAREGDALIGTRVNRLLEQRAADSAAAPDLAPVPIPPETAQISSPSTQANIASINGVDIETVRRIRDSDAKRSEAALIESLAPNNAQGQPGGILGAKYPEGRGSYSTSIAEALLNSDPFSGELSPSQIARNQETLRNTLRREEIAQQRADSIEAGRIMRDAADTREAFSVPLESGIAKAVVPKSVLSGEQNAILNAIDEFSLPSKNERVVPTSEAVVPENVLSSEQLAVLNAIDKFSLPSSTKQVVKSPAEELIGVSGPLPEAFTGTETENRAADAANAIAALTNTAEPEVVVPKAVPTTESRLSDVENATAIRDAALETFIMPDVTEDSAIKTTSDVPEGVVGAKVEAVPEVVETAKPENKKGHPLYGTLPPFLTNTLDAIAETTGVDVRKIGDGALSNPLYGDVDQEIADATDKVVRIIQGRDVKGVSKSVGDADQQLAEEQVSAQDSAEDLLKELSAERAANQQEQRQVEMEAEGDKKVVSPPVAPKIAPAVTEKITTLGEEADLGKGFGGDGSIGDLTKDYVKLLKSLLGESDEDKAARKGELFMLMGAALMSGKSSNALTNIGDALQIGAKAAIQDRTTRKKRDDTIGLKGLELAVAEEGRNEAARVRKEDRTQKLDDAKDLALYRAGLKPAKEFLETPTGKLMKEVYVKILSDGLAQSQQLDVVRKNAFDALGTFSEDAQGAFRRAAMFAEQAVIGQSQTGSQDFAVDEETEG